MENNSKSDDKELEIDSSLLALKKGNSTDFRIKTFIRFYQEGNLNLRPSYQRNEVINQNKASGIIESAILGIPLPPIYLFMDNEGKYEVIDGQQRLLSFLGFLNVLEKSLKTKLNGFQLRGLKILSNLNGKITQSKEFTIFLNAKVRDFTIKTIVFEEEKGFEPRLKYEIFERLNKNPYPIKPNSFELWNCIYLSNYTRMIKDIAGEPLFIDLIARKRSKEKDLRMDNENDILRHIVLAEKYPTMSYKKDFSKKYLHDSVEYHFKHKTSIKDLAPIKKGFLDTLNKVKLIFGNRETIAHVVNSEKSNLNLTQLDIILITFAGENIKFLQKYSDELLEQIKSFFSDVDNRIIIQNSKRGKNKSAFTLKDRVEYFQGKTFEFIRKKYGIIDSERINIRSHVLIERLLKKQNNKCPYCKNIIKPTDETHIDHWQSLSEFGTNDEDNLCVLHIQCNLEKGPKTFIK